MSSDNEADISFYDLRKQPHMQLVKGISSKGKTIRSRSGKIPLCKTCCSDSCEHANADRNTFTDNSRLQKKNVHKCDCCSDTHVCEHLIPLRGRHIKPDTDTA